jgi:hypothetical protein
VADQSPRAIALSLNGIAGPRGRGWGASTINGNAIRGTGNLNNRIYVGKLVWNKLRYVKDPDTRKRRSKANKARVAASLTLISQALEAIRGLIDKIVLTPAEGILRVDLHGEAAAILQLSVASKKGRFQLRENAEELAMVAGLGDWEVPCESGIPSNIVISVAMARRATIARRRRCICNLSA